MLLSIKNLHFTHNPERPLFQNLNLNIGEGKIVALAGESGCGKSTLLNLIYGLLDWHQGEIWFDDEKLYGPKGNIVPGEKKMKMVAQDYDLLPYATVYDNVGKFLSNINLKKKREKVMELLDVVGLRDFADVKPKFLSGGQQQRVAIARALSEMPKMLILDEPFSNLDFSRKVELREKLFSYVRENGIALIISTHEILEVMPWVDQIIVLQEGRMIQSDDPEETYRNPYNEYVARMLGEVNIFDENAKQSLNLKRTFYFPHQIQISENGIEAEIAESRFSGSHYWTKLLLGGTTAVAYTSGKVSGKVRVRITDGI